MSGEAGGSDVELALAARAGSREAFGVLVLRHRLALFRFLRARAGSREDAEELLQEAFLRCWTRLELYDPARPFSTWLYTLAVRLAASRGRRARLPVADDSDPAQVADHGTGPGGDPVGSLAAREQRDNLWQLAARVCGPEQRSALWLFYAEGRSAAEIGGILGKHEAAVRALLHRARQRLAACLAAAAGQGARAQVGEERGPKRG